MRVAPAAALLLTAALAGTAAAQQTGQQRSIVEEALRGAEEAQQADKERVDRMSQEAARAAEGSPSGAEAVGSTAPPAQAAVRAPSGGPALSLRAMIDRPLADRNGEAAGTVRDVLLGAESGGTLVLVEEAGGGGAVRAVNAARVMPAPDGGGGYYVDLDRGGIAALPGYRREGEAWRLAE